MKRIFICLTLLSLYQISFSQDETYQDHRRRERERKEQEKNDDEPKGFNWDRVFVDGALSLGYGTNQNGDGTTNTTFNIGIIPEIGYSLSRSFDAGISTGVNYTSTINSAYDAKAHNTAYSLGAFARVYPLSSFFIQAMPEQDFINFKTIYSGGIQNTSYQSTALLIGLGVGRREIGKMYFSTLVMLDVIKDINSPYWAPTSYVNINGGYLPLSYAPVPILRGVIGFYPFRKKQK